MDRSGRVMFVVPLHDRAGNVLVALKAIAEPELSALDSEVPVAASFVVVVLNGAILMIFDSWRRQWELPGGTREKGETPAQAARRELYEETGIDSVELNVDSIAEFELRLPARREYAAVYRAELRAVPHLVVNNEAMASWRASAVRVARRVRRAVLGTDPEQSGHRAQVRPNNPTAAVEKTVGRHRTCWTPTSPCCASQPSSSTDPPAIRSTKLIT
jgi:8-oxo-dGTP diphosphatase